MLAADRLHCSPLDLAAHPDGRVWLGRALAARVEEHDAREWHEFMAKATA